MKFLEILEKAWLVACVAAIVLGIYNFVMIQRFSSSVYFPFICSGFCTLIYYNIRGQRRFATKMRDDAKAQPPATTPK
jgi:hypothetical protein